MSAASYCLLINQMTSYQIARNVPTGILAGSVQIVKQRRAHIVCDVADFCLVILVVDAGRKRCTVVTVPNAEFSAMQLENFAQRDFIWYHLRLGLRYETTPEQLRYVLVEIRRMLYAHPKAAVGRHAIPALET